MKPSALVDCPVPGTERRAPELYNLQGLRAKAQHHRAKQIKSHIPSKLKPGIELSPGSLRAEASDLELKPRDLTGVLGCS